MNLSPDAKVGLQSVGILAISGSIPPQKAVEDVNSLLAGCTKQFSKAMAVVNLGKDFIASKIKVDEYFAAISTMIISRTSPELVVAKLGEDYDGKRDVCPAILSANILVNRVAAIAAANGHAWSDTGDGSEAEVIERYLACHFYETSDPSYQSMQRNGSSGTFVGQTGDKLNATRYGRDAMEIDATGELMKVGMREVITGGLNATGAIASCAFIGRNRFTSVPWRER